MGQNYRLFWPPLWNNTYVQLQTRRMLNTENKSKHHVTMSKRTWKRIRHCDDPVSRPAELDEGPHHSDSSVHMFSPLKSLLAKVADLSSFSTSSFSYLFLPQCSHLNWLLSFLIYAFPAVAHPHHNFTVVNVSGVLLFSQKRSGSVFNLLHTPPSNAIYMIILNDLLYLSHCLLPYAFPSAI